MDKNFLAGLAVNVVFLFIYFAIILRFLKNRFLVEPGELPSSKIFRNSLIATAFFGVGAIGGQGFAVPAPSGLALLAIPLLDNEALSITIPGSIISFCIFLAFFYLRDRKKKEPETN